MIKRHITTKEAFDAELTQAFAEAKSGAFVSSQAVCAWMDSLDEDPRAAFPDPDVNPS